MKFTIFIKYLEKPLLGIWTEIETNNRLITQKNGRTKAVRTVIIINGHIQQVVDLTSPIPEAGQEPREDLVHGHPENHSSTIKDLVNLCQIHVRKAPMYKVMERRNILEYEEGELVMNN